MNLLFVNFTRNYAGKDPAVFDEEKSMQLKARLSLLIVWTSAFLICLLLVLYTFIPQPMQSFFLNNSLWIKMQKDLLRNGSFQLNGNNNDDLFSNDNNAFVFVNINKQFFLTRFPSGRQEEQVIATGSNGAAKAGLFNVKETGRVIRKIKTVNKNPSYIDFSIKPVPQ